MNIVDDFYAERISQIKAESQVSFNAYTINRVVAEYARKNPKRVKEEDKIIFEPITNFEFDEPLFGGSKSVVAKESEFSNDLIFSADSCGSDPIVQHYLDICFTHGYAVTNQMMY